MIANSVKVMLSRSRAFTCAWRLGNSIQDD